MAVPSQDMILGLYYLMHDPIVHARTCEEAHQSLWKPRRSADGLSFQRQLQLVRETLERPDGSTIWGAGCTSIEKIKVLIEGGIIETTPGRVIFNTIVPKELGFQNYVLRKKRLSELVLECYKKIDLETTVRFLDKMKNLGFAEAISKMQHPSRIMPGSAA